MSKLDDLPVTLSDIMQKVIDETSIPESYGILQHGEGVDLLPANIDLSGMVSICLRTMCTNIGKVFR